MMSNKTVRLFVFILMCQGAGLVGSIFTFDSINTWYSTLQKPFFNPPNYIFGPVWTLLYTMMGISLFLVWGKKKANLRWFWAQLALNTLWSIVFFGLKNPSAALVVVVFLWISIFKTIISFKKVNKNASYLLYPYLTWVTFASILNLAIMLLN